MISDTIAAVSTAFGEGAVALLRVSGADARELVAKVLKCNLAPDAWEPRRAQLGEVEDADGSRLDEVLFTYFKAPYSYTGEDLIEIGCHGGIFVTGRVFEALLAAGARSADPGEFTQRAFLNGKLDLTQAEAVMDLISARSELALKSANEQLAGRLGQGMTGMRADLLGLLAHIEAYIDFPDEDIDPETGALFVSRVEAVGRELDKLLAGAEEGRVLREGVKTAICGEPNVGKSSLLNRLLGFDRAIVSATAGTTRDTIEEIIHLRGIPLRLIDTAGMRESADEIENEGIARARQVSGEADLVLEVVDASQDRATALRQEVVNSERLVVVLNKSDLGVHPSWEEQEGIAVSCEDGAGIDDLSEAVYARLQSGSIGLGTNPVAINARHKRCLAMARGYLDAALGGMKRDDPPELVSVEVRAALDSIGEVLGRVDAEELLGEIFGSFCIGK